MAFCGFCGRQAADMDNFCRNCGSKINEFTIEKIGEVIKKEHRKYNDHDSNSNYNVSYSLKDSRMKRG